MKEALRLTRDLIDRLPPRTDERGPVVAMPPDPNYYRQTAGTILSQLERPDELWVFAAGSLIWDPRFEVAERRAAHIDGWRRAFCIGDRRFRGCPSAPGLMMSLERGGTCSGVVLRMASEDIAASLLKLLEREPPLPPDWVEAHTESGPVKAIIFSVDPSWSLYVAEPQSDDLADILASAVGHVGTMAEYLLNTVTELEKAGVHDPHLWSLQSMVAERLERLPASKGQQ